MKSSLGPGGANQPRAPGRFRAPAGGKTGTRRLNRPEGGGPIDRSAERGLVGPRLRWMICCFVWGAGSRRWVWDEEGLGLRWGEVHGPRVGRARQAHGRVYIPLRPPRAEPEPRGHDRGRARESLVPLSIRHPERDHQREERIRMSWWGHAAHPPEETGDDDVLLGLGSLPERGPGPERGGGSAPRVSGPQGAEPGRPGRAARRSRGRPPNAASAPSAPRASRRLGWPAPPTQRPPPVRRTARRPSATTDAGGRSPDPGACPSHAVRSGVLRQLAASEFGIVRDTRHPATSASPNPRRVRSCRR